MTEAEGCLLLREAFERAGYSIVPNASVNLGSLLVELDGWDAARRVGFEYITTEACDRHQFTPDTIAGIEALNAAGAAAILLVDEADVDAKGLQRAAAAFLQRLAGRAR
jgi:hypothetical protein